VIAYSAAGPTIKPGEHHEVEVFGLTFNIDTIIGSVIAAAVVLGLGFLVRAKLTTGVPNGVQLVFESLVRFVRDQIEQFLSVKIAPFLIPIGMSLFTFILACNWISVLPLHAGGQPILEPPTADVNLVYALALLMFVWWHYAGIKHQGGAGTHFLHVAQNRFAPFAPMWIVLVFADLMSLPLRLFGNMFAGGMMVSLLSLVPPYFSWLPLAGWKLFDMGIGLLQAYLFMLLTISYFKESMGIDAEDETLTLAEVLESLPGRASRAPS
jgi:F-type H+-transporting ATPase subunit a